MAPGSTAVLPAPPPPWAEAPPTMEGPDVIVPLRWPEESARRDQLAAAAVPRLLVVSAGASPPKAWAIDEDWILAEAPTAERGHREATLRRRLDQRIQPPRWRVVGVTLDNDGLVRREGRWVALSGLEVRLVAVLLAERGRCVSRARLLEAGWPGQQRDDRAVDGAVRRARAKLAVLGVEIHGITGAGYLLEVGTAPAA